MLKDTFVKVTLTTGVLGLIIVPPVIEAVKPVTYNNCYVSTIQFTNTYEGEPDFINGYTYTTRKGVNGEKRTCQASKPGHEDKITIIRQPVAEHTIYTPNETEAAQPEYSSADATALCNDGTYSWSVGSGTCSHHQGISTYLY